MKHLLLALLLALVPVTLFAAPEPVRHAVAQAPTPVLNTPNFADAFSGARRLDPCQGVRPIEFVALPGTLFTVHETLNDHGITVYRVTSTDYPYPSSTGYFVDARFVKKADAAAPERTPHLPALAEIQRGLLASLGRPYVWGGNLRDGVPLIGELYPKGDRLAGVDCSGLLYEATDGYTPRNTSALTGFGQAVPIAGLSAEQIAHKLKPLDLIVLKGHVMVVLDGDSIIQSTMGCQGKSGVRLTPIRQTLRGLMANRRPWDDYPQGPAGKKAFVVRRWFTP